MLALDAAASQASNAGSAATYITAAALAVSYSGPDRYSDSDSAGGLIEALLPRPRSSRLMLSIRSKPA